MSKANEAELAALQAEHGDLMTQYLTMTQEFVNTIMPLLSRLRAIEDKVDAAER